MTREKNIPLLDGAVGCVIGKDPKTGALWNVNGGCLVLGRLSKEVAENGQKFFNLFETCGIEILYRQNITTHTWGVLVYNLFQPLCALTGLTPHELFMDQKLRLVYGQLMYESLSALTVASQRGKGDWSPDIWSCVGFYVGTKAFMQLLALPTLFFAPFMWFYLQVKSGIKCPMQEDFHNGRKTQAKWDIHELVSVTIKYKSPAPTLLKLKELFMNAIENPRNHQISSSQLYIQLGSPTLCRTKLYTALSKWGGLIGLIAVLIFLIF